MNTLEKIRELLLEAVYPTVCVCCRRFSPTLLCDECLSCIPLKEKQQCPYCQKTETDQGRLCASCAGKVPLNGIYAARPAKDPRVRALVHALKYNFVQDAAPLLGALTVRAVTAEDLALPDALVPVPLHSRRKRWRGYNQSELLAQYISKMLLPQIDIPVVHALERVRSTAPQVKVRSRSHRLENLHGAFGTTEKARPLKNKRVWLIDDISTTGGTIFECARALQSAKTKSAYGIVAAA